MKVGTDGVLLGAWANFGPAKSLLDIGTGTGLIALMAAQRSGAEIDALEIDGQAAEQALENIKQSTWGYRVKVIKDSLRNYSKTEKKYDFLITNPPFFSNSLPNPNKKRALARHSATLPLCELLEISLQMLNPKGKIALILPTENFIGFAEKAKESGLYLHRQTKVIPCAGKLPKRILAEFCFEKTNIESDELIIEENGRHNYSKEYIELTKDFYLNF